MAPTSDGMVSELEAEAAGAMGDMGPTAPRMPPPMAPLLALGVRVVVAFGLPMLSAAK